MGSTSHVGRGASRSVFEDESGDGWACRRRWLRDRHVGRGTEFIYVGFSYLSKLGVSGSKRKIRPCGVDRLLHQDL